ncbi:MAG TPA: response regulator transcription factor [Candidatus Dormibacteraeota bacterium]
MSPETDERKRIRVMIVDDHEIVRSGLKSLLASHDDLAVVAEAADAATAVARAGAMHPDVVIMDVNLGSGRTGIEATRDIRSQRPQTQVLMLTSFADEEAMFASIMAGACGYVLKEIHGSELVEAIRRAGSGQGVLDPAMTSALLDRVRRSRDALKDEKLARLTPHEERILTLITEGKTNAEIAEELHLAEKTIKNYVSAILSKLEVSRRAEAAAYLARRSRPGGSGT